jgi:hypothetical protein
MRLNKIAKGEAASLVVEVRVGQPLPWRCKGEPAPSRPFPANGCLAKVLLLWPPRRIARRSPTYPPHARFETPLFQSSGDLRLHLTLTYHGCPRIYPSRLIFADLR